MKYLNLFFFFKKAQLQVRGGKFKEWKSKDRNLRNLHNTKRQNSHRITWRRRKIKSLWQRARQKSKLATDKFSSDDSNSLQSQSNNSSFASPAVKFKLPECNLLNLLFQNHICTIEKLNVVGAVFDVLKWPHSENVWKDKIIYAWGCCLLTCIVSLLSPFLLSLIHAWYKKYCFRVKFLKWKFW